MRQFMKRLIEGSDSMLKGQTSIFDWFDPKDKKHMEAFAVLQEKGQWPRQFIPEGLEFPRKWKTLLAEKVSEALPGEEDPMRKKPDPATDEAPEDEVLDTDMDDELMDEEPAEVDFEKLYLGRTDDKHFYLVATKSDEGAAEDLQVVDQEGELVYSAEEQGLDPKEIGVFIKTAVKDANIMTLERNPILKYVVPDEEARIEDEDLEDEELPDNLDGMETPEEDKDKNNSSVSKKSPFESKENKVNESYGDAYIEKDIKRGLDRDRIIAKIQDRYPDISTEDAGTIHDNVAAGKDGGWDKLASANKDLPALESEEIDPSEKEWHKEQDFLAINKSITDMFRNEGFTPLNEQPSATGIHLEFEKDGVVIKVFVPSNPSNECVVECSKLDEKKIGLDYVTQVKKNVKKAVAAIKDKDSEAAADALDKVADDATDASKAIKKTKAVEEEEQADADAKEKEELDEKEEIEEGIKVGDEVEFTRDFQWKSSGDTMGWNKGDVVTVVGVEDDAFKIRGEGSEVHTIETSALKKAVDEKCKKKVKEETIQEVDCAVIANKLVEDDEFNRLVQAQLADPENSDAKEAVSGYVQQVWGDVLNSDSQAVISVVEQAMTGLEEKCKKKVKEESDSAGEDKNKYSISWALRKEKEAKAKKDKEEVVDESTIDETTITDEKGNSFSIQVIDEGDSDVTLQINQREFHFKPDFAKLYGIDEAGRLTDDGVKVMALETISHLDETEYAELIGSGKVKESEVEEGKVNEMADKYYGKECKTILNAIDKELLKEGVELTIVGGLLDGRKATVKSIKEGNVSVNVVDDAGAALNVNITGEANINIGADGSISVTPTPTELPEVPMEDELVDEIPAEEEIAGAPGEEEEVPEIPGDEELEDEFESKDKKKTEEDEMNLKTDEAKDKKKTEEDEMNLKTDEKCKKKVKEEADSEDDFVANKDKKNKDKKDKTDEGLGDQTKEVFEVEFVRDGKPDSTRVMAYDEAAAKKMLEQKPSVEEVTGCKQISGVKEADDKDELSGSPEDMTVDEPETKPEHEMENAAEGEYVLVSDPGMEGDERDRKELGRFATPEEADKFMTDRSSASAGREYDADAFGEEDPDAFEEGEMIKLITPEGKEYFWEVHGGFVDDDGVFLGEEDEPGDVFGGRDALESAKKLLDIDQVDEFKVEETIKVGDTVMVCDDSLKCVVEEATVHEIDEKKGFELTGNTIPEEQVWYNTEYFQIDKL